jgi:hypothetical protein
MSPVVAVADAAPGNRYIAGVHIVYFIYDAFIIPDWSVLWELLLAYPVHWDSLEARARVVCAEETIRRVGNVTPME